jgi:hypothetical protein
MRSAYIAKWAAWAAQALPGAEGGAFGSTFSCGTEARFVEALSEDRRAPLETNCESSCYYAIERGGPVAERITSWQVPKAAPRQEKHR